MTATNAVATHAPRKHSKPAQDIVTVRITKAGDGQVHTGETDPETGADAKYPKDALVKLPRYVAEALEGRHFAEIQDQ